MHSHTLSKLLLTGTVLVVASVGVAQTTYSTYAAATDAARVQFEAKDYAGAQKAMEQAVALAKTSDEKQEALVRLARTYAERKLYPQAREQFRRILQLPNLSTEDRVAVQGAIGATYSQEENWSQSLAEFEKVLAIPGVAPQAQTVTRIAIAGALFNLNQEAKGRAILAPVAEDTTVDTSTRASAYVKTSESFARDNQLDQARQTLIKARDLPELPADTAAIILGRLSKIHKIQGDEQLARDESIKAQALLINQYNALFAAKEFEQAQETLDLYLQLDDVSPSMDATMRLQQGYLFQAEDKPVQAREVFGAVIQKQYNNVPPNEVEFLVAVKQGAQLAIAKTYVQEANKVQAKQVLQKLLAIENLEPGVQNGAQELLKSLD